MWWISSVLIWFTGMVLISRSFYREELRDREKEGKPLVVKDGEKGAMAFLAAIWPIWGGPYFIVWAYNKLVFEPIETPSMKQARINKERKERDAIITKLEKSELPPTGPQTIVTDYPELIWNGE